MLYVQDVFVLVNMYILFQEYNDNFYAPEKEYKNRKYFRCIMRNCKGRLKKINSQFVESGFHTCSHSEAKRKFFSKSFIKNISDNLLNDFCPVPNKLNIETTLLGSQSINLPPKSLMCRKIWYRLRRTRWNPSPSQNFLIPPEQAL